MSERQACRMAAASASWWWSTTARASAWLSWLTPPCPGLASLANSISSSGSAADPPASRIKSGTSDNGTELTSNAIGGAGRTGRGEVALHRSRQAAAKWLRREPQRPHAGRGAERTPHSARHSFISTLQAQGIEVDLVANPTVTLGHYTRSVRGGAVAATALERAYAAGLARTSWAENPLTGHGRGLKEPSAVVLPARLEPLPSPQTMRTMRRDQGDMPSKPAIGRKRNDRFE